MIVFASPHSRLIIRVRFRKPRDIDVQAVLDVDPSRIDDVETISTLSFYAGRVDVEEVGAAHGWVVRGDVFVVGEIPMLTEVGEGGAGNLSVNVPVPWQHLEACR